MKKKLQKKCDFFSDIGNTAKNQQKFVYFTAIFHNKTKSLCVTQYFSVIKRVSFH